MGKVLIRFRKEEELEGSIHNTIWRFFFTWVTNLKYQKSLDSLLLVLLLVLLVEVLLLVLLLR